MEKVRESTKTKTESEEEKASEEKGYQTKFNNSILQSSKKDPNQLKKFFQKTKKSKS